ncbi:MAG TPA: hypothetical protein PK230_04780 [Chitinophagales bacterium]|nr:hypothetical protein [Chitinophagales bacterium]
MGIGFVILIHLVAIFLLSTVIAMVWVNLTQLFSTEEKRKRKMLFAGLAPFVGLYTLYFLLFGGTIIISEIKNVDIGIGDYWYVPIKDNCKLAFIDLPESSYIIEGDTTVIQDVEFIEQTEKNVIGKTYDNIYFSYDLNAKILKKIETESELMALNNNQKPNFKKTTDFYNDRKNELIGISFIIVRIVSLLLTFFKLWILRKLFLGQLKETVKKLLSTQVLRQNS